MVGDVPCPMSHDLPVTCAARRCSRAPSSGQSRSASRSKPRSRATRWSWPNDNNQSMEPFFFSRSMAQGPLAGGLRSRWVALDCRVSAYARPRGRRLGPVAGAKPTMSASRGPSSAMAVAGRSHSPLRAVVATACWTATLSKLHQRRRQPLAALARTAGGARGVRVCTKRRRSASQSRCQRPPTSQASTRRRCGPGPRSSGYRSSLRRRAASRAAPSVRWDWCAGMACRVSGLTRVASQHSASP